MNQLASMPVSNWSQAALGAALLPRHRLAFAAWIDKGAGIFMATVESGLAWCF